VRRCLLLFDAPDGGVPEHVMLLSLGLPERGWEPWLVGPESASSYRLLRRTGVPITTLPFRAGYRHPVDDGRVVAKLVGLMRRRRFDLVNTHSPKAGVIGRLVALACGVPTVSTAHGFAFDPRTRRWPGRAVSLRIERLLAPRTDALICVSEAMRRLALEYELTAPHGLLTVHNGTPSHDPALEPDPELAKFATEGPLAGCIMALRPGKARNGVRVFLEAGRHVLACLPGARLAVIGNGVLRAELERYARALGHDRRLRFFDYRPPSARALRSLDLFVLSTPFEAFPIAPLEAMACGVPQVATDVGGTAEAVAEGETGLLCPPNDPPRLAERIVRLLSDPDLRVRMSVASRERHRRLFTVDRMLDETASVFDRVADGGPLRQPTAGLPHRATAQPGSPRPVRAMKTGGGDGGWGGREWNKR
jgi:glycosyltransferase involved in cell wall biosynthesis